jgi:phosphoglycolate phosphatase
MATCCDPVDDAATAFRGGRAMLRLGFERVRPEFTEAEVDAQYQRLLDAYEAGIDRETRLYPGGGAGVAVGRRTGMHEQARAAGRDPDGAARGAGRGR